MALSDTVPVGVATRPATSATAIRWRIGWPAVLALAAFATTLVVTGRLLVVDALMNLYSGRLIAAHGLPSADTLTVAGHGRRWVDQQWLAHLVFYESFRWVGWWAPALLCAAAVAAAVGMLAKLLLERGVAPGLALAFPTVSYFVAVENTTVRSQTLAYPLFVAVLAIVLSDERRGRPALRSLTAVALLVVWANVHGSVLIGAGMLAGASVLGLVRAVWRRDGRAGGGFAALALLAALAVFATPYRPDELVAYYRSVMANPVIPRAVSEWQAPTLLTAWPFFLLCAGAAVAALWSLRRRARLSMAGLLLAAALAVAGFTAIRYDVWFALASALVAGPAAWGLISGRAGDAAAARPQGGLDRIAVLVGAAAVAAAAALPLIVPSRTSQLSAVVFGGVILAAQGSARRRPGRVVLAGVLAVVVSCLAATVGTPAAEVYAGSSLPAMDAAAGYLRAHPGATVLADSSTAPGLLWLHPELAGRVGYDVRYEIYSQPALERYVRFTGGYASPGWRGTLAGYSVVVVSRTLAPGLTRAVARLPGWRVIESDPRGLTAVRDRAFQGPPPGRSGGSARSSPRP